MSRLTWAMSPHDQEPSYDQIEVLAAVILETVSCKTLQLFFRDLLGSFDRDPLSDLHLIRLQLRNSWRRCSPPVSCHSVQAFQIDLALGLDSMSLWRRSFSPGPVQ